VDRRLIKRQPQPCGFGDGVAQLSVSDARKLLTESDWQGCLARRRLPGTGVARGWLDFPNAEADRVDVDAHGFQPDHDLAHEQRQLLRPTGGRDVHQKLATALGSRLGARGDTLADDATPLLAIDRGASEASRGVARARQEAAERSRFRGATHDRLYTPARAAKVER
jgi:hypothetical protein